MFVLLNKLDSTITYVINSFLPHNSFFNYFFSFFSLRGNSILIWLVIMLFLIIFEEKRDKKFIIYFLIAFLTTVFLVNVVIKNIVQRPRPTTKISNCPKDFSFPSGHASTAFAAATVIAFYDKKRKWFYYSIAGFISLSRIYLGCHYLLDVVSGGIIGYVISLLLQTFLYTFPFRRKN